MVALLAAFSNFDAVSGASVSALDPGPLSDVHAGFTTTRGCGACHGAHDLDGLQWLAAAVKGHDQTGQCLECHTFEGDERAAHNRSDLGTSQVPVPTPRCTSCHSEHKGENFALAEVSDRLCANCHQPVVTSFDSDHPAFGKDFPYRLPNNVRFDHDKHLNTYFVANSKWLKQAERDADFAREAKAACTTCHALDTASREVSPRSFEDTCAKCHQHQVRERPFVLFLPEELTAPFAHLLGLEVDGDDEEEAAAKVASTMEALANTGVDGLAHLVGQRDSLAEPGAMLEGLDNTLLKAAAEVWVDPEGEFEAPDAGEADPGGWRAGEDDEGLQSLRYIPRRHADPVLVNWIDFFDSRAKGATESEIEASEVALGELLDASEGAGACGKCHRTGLLSHRSQAMAQAPPSPRAPKRWRYTGPSKRTHTHFSHRPHIDILGPEASCATCHTLDPDADYAAYFEDDADVPYTSNFKPIEKATCQQCHRPGGVTQSCKNCHQYHRAPGFKRALEVPKPDTAKGSHEAAPGASPQGQDT